MKALVFFMLFSFSVSSVIAQQTERSIFISGCQSEAPTGFTEAEIAALYENECGDNTPTVEITPFLDGDDCNWTLKIYYKIYCGEFYAEFAVDYFGGDNTPPTLNEGAEIPEGGQGLDLCLDNVPVGPTAASIAALYSDNCSDVIVTKSGAPSGSDCEWSVDYLYSIQDACGNMASDFIVSYSGGDNQAPYLNKGAVIPTGESGLNLCFSDKSEGPTVEDIASLFSDNCGNVIVEKQSVSKGSDCKWLAEYTYIIKDDCNNFADSIVLQYFGGDQENPELSGVPEDITVNCVDEIPLASTKGIYATDNCSDKILISSSDDTSSLGDACEGGVVIRTYSATDDCGRSVAQSQTITVLPAPESTVVAPELPTSISCEEATSYVAPDATYNNGVSQGACSIAGSIEGEVSTQYSVCGGELSITYNGVDSCGRTLTAGPYVILVEPAPAAEFDSIVGGSLTCEEADTFVAESLGYSNGSDGVCSIEGSVEGVIYNEYTICGGFLYVDYIFTDDCDRTIAEKITYTVEPAPMAIFGEVEDMVISCEEAGSFTAGSLGYTNGASTEGCLIAGSVDGELSGEYTECGGALTVNWTYTDECERTIQASQTITVEPAPLAVFDEVEDMTISCDEAGSFTAGSLGYTNGASNEACVIEGSVDGELSGEYTACGGTLMVNWTYTDECQRTIEASQTITVEPAPMAVFDEVEDMTISCDEAGSFTAGSLGYSNGASNEACVIEGSVDGELSRDYTACGGTLTVNWTYTDECERTIEASQTITVEPAPMAIFDEVEDMTISCEEAGLFTAGSLGYTNGALNKACVIEGSVDGELSGEYTECGGTLTVNWTYTDECKRTIEASQTITVEPAPMAVFDEVEDMTISCEEAGSFTAGSLGYTNGASNEACVISGSVDGELSGMYTECGGSLTVNWTYTDACERTIEASQTITVEPAPMAVFDEVENMTISCDEAGSFTAGSLGYTNGASNEACVIEGSVEGELSGDYTECGGTLYVDWTYTDYCERTITTKQEITVEPAPMAVFDEVEDVTISCDEAGSFTAGSLGYTNGASNEACAIEGSVDGELSGEYTECGGTLTVNWTYTDDCERTIEASQTIIVEPAPMAVFDEVEDMTITCDEAGSFTASSLEYTNGASNEACLIAGSVDGELSGEYTECGGTLTVNWTYTDDCQRTIEASQTITVEPAPMAVFDEVEDMMITCDEAGSFKASSLEYTNGASNEACLIAGSVDGELSGEYTECGGTLTVNWTYTDDCERTIVASQTVIVEPAPVAVFDEVENMTISCEEAGSFTAESLGYTNGASNEACVIEGSIDGELSGDYTECGGTLYVDWTYTDECDRTITAKQEITVEPAPMAVFDEVQDITIACDLANQYQVGSLSYTNGASNEACLISGSVDGELSGEYTECGGTLYVDWTFTDECDRTITARKTITVSPAPSAAFDEVDDMTISCDEAGSFTAGSLGYTNGASNEACLIEGSVDGELSGEYTECGGTLTVNWTYTDDCERTIEASQTITVEPAPMAVFDEVENMTISCDEAGSFTAGSLGYTNGASTEACLIAGSVEGELSGTYTECGGTLSVDWTYTDDCERTITAKQEIIVEPAPMAVFNEVEDMTISCEEAGLFVAGSLGYTNGASNEACVIEGSVDGELSGEYTECGGTLMVNWTYTDECQRTIEASQTITVEPSPMAVFEEVENITISCEEAGSFTAGSLGYTNGASNEACLISGSVEGELSGEYTECGGLLFVDWTYTDDCDRTITARQQIKINPAPMAVFDEVENITISCDEAGSFTAGSLGYTNGASNEACVIEGSVDGELSGTYTECGGTLTVNWTYTDECQRTIEASQTITVEPAPAPVFDEIENMTISCDEAGSFTASSLGYTNGASTEACLISGSVEGQLSGTYTECGGTLYVDWTYTDDCERIITAKQEIEVEPAPMAVFDEVEDMIISCEEAGSFAASSLGYTNGASTEACVIEGSVDGELSGEYTECGGTLTVNWTYTDDCERTIEASQTITVEPAPMAVFDEVENMTISCDEAGSFTAGALGYTNGASNEACVIAGSVEGELSGTYTECGGTLSVDWTYTDDCQRTITAKQEITVEPAPMAVFDEVEDMTISCEEAGSFTAGSLGYSNGASNEACVISGSVNGELSGEYTECGGTLMVNWTYTDECERTIEASQTITVEPAPMAVFDEVEDMTISCEEAGSFTAGSLGYTNGASNEACVIEGSVDGELSGEYTECGGTLTVNWTYTDECQRTIEASQTITVEPAPMAVFDEVEDMTISCEEANSFVAGSLGYTNGASNEACLIEGSVDGEATPDYTECGGTILVNWTYTDDCERTIEASQTITVEPAPMAAFEAIEDATIACEDLASYEAEFLSYTNGGTEACLIAGSVQGEAQPFEGSCGTFEVDFTFTDDCGRTITAKQLVTVIDETAPVLVGELPMGESDVNVCFADAPEGPSVEDVAALFTDNCGNVNVTKTVFSPDENTDCLWAIVIRYDVQDDCGNYATPVKIAYNGGDTSAPVLEGELPVGTSGLQCLSENPGAPEAGAIRAAYTDNCGDVIVTALEPSIEGDDCGWIATYTYTVEDSCGNFADNVVIVNSGADTMAPVLVGETPPTIVNSIDACKDGDLGEPSAEDIAALYSDNCSEVTVVKVEKLSIGSDCEWIKVFEYTAKDVCGNTAELIKFTYSGGDQTAPEPTGVCDNEVMTIGTEVGATCPADASISLEIGDEITAGDNSWSVAGLTVADMNGTLVPCFTDNCADVSELTYRVTDKGMTGDDCSKTLTITFEVEDNCENVSEPFTCTFIIVDDTAPVVECPEGEDYGVVAETPSGFADKAPYADNCQEDGQTQDYEDVITEAVGETTYVSGDFVFTFEEGYVLTLGGLPTGTQNDNPYYSGSITDLNGSPLSNYGTFEVIYNPSSGQYDIMQDLGSGASVAGSATANAFDMCDATAWIFNAQDGHNKAFTLECPEYETTIDYTLVRTFTANDGCGNEASCDVTYTWTIADEDNAVDLECGTSVTGDTSDGGAEDVTIVIDYG
ncbi:HYR-like domain-containing protein, partial [Psychroserpens damuponensis]|uniref:HYR-like domain-containing protein n=1 Tax=Psychroserpens damuponensis TaxID=943936 RepID=UPI00058B2AD5